MKPAVLLGMIRGADQIAAALLNRISIELITLYEPAGRLLKSAGIPHRKLDEFATEAQREAVVQRAERRGKAIASQFYTPAFRAQWPQFDDLTWATLRNELVRFLTRDLIEEMFIVDSVRRCAGRTDLRLVLVPEDYGRDTRTTILSAQRLGIPALHLLHGYPYHTQNAHDVASANRIAVYSEHCKSIIESFGVTPDRIEVTGNPAWDIYATPPEPGLKETVCSRMGLDPSRPIIEYAMTGVNRFSAVSQLHPTYHLETAMAVIEAFADLARRYPAWQFLLRPHPIKPIASEDLLEHARRIGLSSLTIDGEPAQDVLAVTSVFLCTHSNMGIEALLRGVPVINVAVEAIGGPIFRAGIGPLFLDTDAVLQTRTTEDIGPAIEAALLDTDTRSRLDEVRPQTIQRLNHANDGQATERLCALAMEMIAHNDRFVDPVSRFPEFESHLAQAVPHDSRNALICGRAAKYVAATLQSIQPQAEIHTVEAIESCPDSFDCVVFADPVPHSEEAVQWMREARARVNVNGTVLAAFPRGAGADALEAFYAGEWAPAQVYGEVPTLVGQFSRVGLEIVLSRGDLEPVTLFNVGLSPSPTPSHGEPIAETAPSDLDSCGWVVCARPRPQRLSPYASARQDRKRRADLSNRIGERRFAKGDPIGAISAFAKAIQLWNEDALYFSNLAAALYSTQELEAAWRRIREAVYLDPALPVARANYRMIAAALGKSAEAEHVLGLFGTDHTCEITKSTPKNE